MRKTDRKKTSGRSGTIKKYFYTKTWDTSFKTNTFSVEEINYRIENNLPLDDLYTTLNEKYTRNGKYSKHNGNKDL